ncbi:MAG TPA: ABC transporter ATP-binding protein [Acidobacteriota bacterium]
MSALLAARTLRFAYSSRPSGSREVLCGIDLDVNRGDFLGVIGANGSGKTTLLKLLAGLLRPSGGELRLDGRRLDALSARARARRIALVSQAAPTVFDYRALDLVLLGRTPYLGPLKLERAEDLAAARRALAATDAEAFADRPLRTLSGGELQRVLLATAVAQESELLLLDEPTTHLDLKHRVELYRLLGRLHREGKTLVLVSHDINLIAEHCTEVLLLRDGRLLERGPVERTLRPEALRAALEVETIVDRSPLSGRPRITVRGLTAEPASGSQEPS